MPRTSTQSSQKVWIRWRNGIAATRTELPFFWFLTLLLLGFLAAFWFLFPELSVSVKLMITPLMLLHTTMYWFNLALDMHNRREFLLYMGIQVFLLAVILLLANNTFFVPALFMTLIGQITGFVIPGGQKFTTILVLVFLMLLAFWWFDPAFIKNPAMMTLAVGLVIVFQLIFTGVYNQTVMAKHQAEEALEKLEIANLKIEQMTRSEERQRIARDLHDTLAQGLSGIILQLDAADHYLEKGECERARQVVQHSMKAARDTLAESRLVIDDLRQANQQQTLGDKLERMCRDPQLNIHLACMLPADLTLREQDLIERLVGEGLTNVRKHAQAVNVQVTLQYDAEKITLQIADDGKGFDPQKSRKQSGHYGLMGMQERLQNMQGKLQIESRPGQGCRLTMQFPRNKEIHHA